MRASATSRTASLANLHASQAKADANKADAASPFALLMEATAPAAKPSRKDARDSGDKPADDGPDAKAGTKADANKAGTQQDDKAGGAPATPAIKSAQSGKTEKSAKDKDDAATNTASDTASDTAGEDQLLVANLQSGGALPPVPTAPILNIPPPPANDAFGDIAIDGPALGGAPASAAPAAQPPAASAAPATTATQPPAFAGTQPPAVPPVAQAQDAVPQTSGSAPAQAAAAAAPAAPAVQTSADAAAQSQTQPNITAQASPGAPTDASQSAGSQSINSQSGNSQSGNSQSDNSQSADSQSGDSKTQILAAAQSLAQSDTKAAAPKDGKPVTAKTAANQKTPSTDTGKIDAPSGGDAKTGETKTNPPQVAAAGGDIPAVKPAPEPAQAINTNFAVHGIAAPQAAPSSPAAAPVLLQQVQVSAQPNLPALAVEIVAKSQSGARQFDIRLDPPELGRVDVRLSIDATGKASAHLSADQPQTLTLLQKDASVLTRALREAGLDVSQDGLNFSLRQQAQGHDGGAGHNNGRGASRAFTLTTTAVDTSPVSTAWRGIADGRLDIRV